MIDGISYFVFVGRTRMDNVSNLKMRHRDNRQVEADWRNFMFTIHEFYEWAYDANFIVHQSGAECRCNIPACFCIF